MEFTNVHSKYGAPMGRREIEPEAGKSTWQGKLYLRKVRLNSGGYDDGGAYWGVGGANSQLYYAWDKNSDVEWHTRAASRAGAARELLSEYPRAALYVGGVK